jgi:formate--tetrahydrofolate ligase
MKSILTVARRLGFPGKEIEPYGRSMAKVSPAIYEKVPRRPGGKYIFVTAMTPTYRGEGKTVTAITLSMALNRGGKESIATLRQPSTGLYFARKGGGSGGGKASLVPHEEIDFHCTGDTHAVTVAHNLVAAHIDNLFFHGNPIGLDRERVYWDRAIDLCDRSLRGVLVGIDKEETKRRSGFIMTQASELMAILSLSRNHEELRERVSKITLGIDMQGNPVRMTALGIESDLIKILRKALLPNLVLSSENTPVILHCGPFSNISHGNCSVLADEVALRMADYIVTEGGGGTDTGFEKFLAIKAPVLQRAPDAVVLVATARALKMHGLSTLDNGRVSEESEWSRRNDTALMLGMKNLERNIKNVKMFGFPLVVAVNRFSFDHDEEIRTIKNSALELGADFAVAHEGWQKGSKGALELSETVMEAAQRPFKFIKLYDDTISVREKISEVADKIYGAEGTTISSEALEVLTGVERRESLSSNHQNAGPCIAKTHLSLSHDSRIKNVPGKYTLPIVGFIPFTGAGYLCALTGNINLMPGMPSRSFGPDFNKNRIEEKG